MGTKNKECPDIKGISVNPTFFDSLNPFALFFIMGTFKFVYGYNRESYS